MTFEEANELCEHKNTEHAGILAFGIVHYSSICCNCDRRKDCKAYFLTFGPVKKCNFYQSIKK